MQYVDWSPSVPGRTGARPVDANGDFDSTSLSPDQQKYEAERHSQFFTDKGARQIYKDHVDFITSRVNSINGWASWAVSPCLEGWAWRASRARGKG